MLTLSSHKKPLLSSSVTTRHFHVSKAQYSVLEQILAISSSDIWARLLFISEHLGDLWKAADWCALVNEGNNHLSDIHPPKALQGKLTPDEKELIRRTALGFKEAINFELLTQQVLEYDPERILHDDDVKRTAIRTKRIVAKYVHTLYEK